MILYIVVILFILMYILNFILDFSPDGQGYHQGAIFELENNWNPYLQKLEKEKTFLYTYNHYVKAIEFSQYSIYSFTKKIETAKIINILFLFSAYCFTYLLIKRIFSHRLFSTFFTFLLVLNPIVINQVFTFYVDLNVYLSFLIYSSLLLLYRFYDVKQIKLLLIMVTVVFINIKLTAFVFVFIIDLFYFIYLYLLKDIKKIKQKISISLVSLLIICCVSWFPFVTNLMDKGSPIYPAAGKEKLDIMEYQIPLSFINNNPFEAFFKSIYFQVNESPYSYVNLEKGINENLEKYKIPYTFNLNEIKYSAQVDTRISGFGFWFSGFFTTSLILFITMIFYLDYDKRKYFILFGLFLIFNVIIFIQGAWWARLVPQLWIFPIFVFFITYYYGNNFLRWVSKINIILVFIMISIIGTQNYAKTFYNSYKKSVMK